MCSQSNLRMKVVITVSQCVCNSGFNLLKTVSSLTKNESVISFLCLPETLQLIYKSQRKLRAWSLTESSAEKIAIYHNVSNPYNAVSFNTVKRPFWSLSRERCCALTFKNKSLKQLKPVTPSLLQSSISGLQIICWKTCVVLRSSRRYLRSRVALFSFSFVRNLKKHSFS